MCKIQLFPTTKRESDMRNPYRNSYGSASMIVQVLSRHSVRETPEQKLAFAVIEQAVKDMRDFIVSGRMSYEPQHALNFIESGSDPYASGVGLDGDFIKRVVNTPLGEGEKGLLDMVRGRLIA